jgi:signal transduction histidine kinase
MTTAGKAVYGEGVRASVRTLLRKRLEPVVLDRLVATALTVMAQLEVWLGHGHGIEHHRIPAAAVALLSTLSVAVRRRFPFEVGVVVPWAGALQLTFWGDPQIFPASIGYLCALYALAVWTTQRRFVLGIGLLVASSAVVLAASNQRPSSTVSFTAVTLVVMVLVRRVLGERERRAQLAERERDLVAREAVVEERARIARELHDAIAHNVSMMVVQAGAERRVLNGNGDGTREVLETIEHIGRGALTEMRRLVGMLRSDSGDPLAPQPGLADLATLTTQVQEAGLAVDLRIDGDPRELPVGIELSAYRIVQEALTNALKHAGNAHAAVRVHYGPDFLELEIIDDGTGSPVPVASGGHGLVGMRERVALYGGRFDAGRLPAGGFAVRVVLPIR